MRNSSHPFIKNLHRRTAQASIGPSALRNQGAPGVIEAARSVAGALDLGRFAACTASSFPLFLDEVTKTMLARFPQSAQSWGAARKAANLFLRDVVYNADLSTLFDLGRVRPWLEVPLDKDVGTSLIAEPEGARLPRWLTIKSLKAPISEQFQSVASTVAARHQINRVDLDVYYWRSNSEEQT